MSFYDDSIFKRIREQQEKIQKMTTPKNFETFASQSARIQNMMKPIMMESIVAKHSRIQNMMYPKTLESIASQAARIQRMTNPPILRYLQEHQNILNRMTSITSKLMNTQASINNNFDWNLQIDQSIVDKVQFALNSSDFNFAFRDLTIEDIVVMDEDILNTEQEIEREKPKMVSDLTVEEFERIINNSIEKSKDIADKPNLLNIFLREMIKGLVINESLQIVLVILQIVMTVLFGFAYDNHDYEVKEKVQTIVNDSKYGKAYQKIFINEGIEYPIAPIGYLRKSTLIRNGPKRTTPLSEKVVIPKNTVVTIIGRKGNWLMIQIDREDNCYFGWIEESKLIKFKLNQ